jgi:hypothetical protein
MECFGKKKVIYVKLGTSGLWVGTWTGAGVKVFWSQPRQQHMNFILGGNDIGSCPSLYQMAACPEFHIG